MPSILLIDDDASNREPTGRLLRSEGFEVVRAANGRDALELLDNCQVDLILLDLLMPEMDGLTFLQTLRERPTHKDMPVVMLTGLTDGEAVDKSQKLGVSEYLIKSRFTPEHLVAVVREQLMGAEELRSR